MKTSHFFITGSSRGIGRALVEHALAQPATYVYGFARSEERLIHERYQHTTINLSKIDELITRLGDIFPALDTAERIVLINNAGTLGEIKYLGDIDDQSIAALFNLNVTAPSVLMNAFLRRYRDTQAQKVIVNVSSGAGKYPVDGWSGYCASKAALDMMSQAAALEQKIRGASQVYIYALAPGVVDTPMQGQIRATDAANFSKLDKFVDYKTNEALDDPRTTAEKFFQLIDHPQQFEEVLQDVRQF